ncbi:MAG: archease [Bacteroidetes bacterium]|nr:archease [Bacteroidota bacterium]
MEDFEELDHTADIAVRIRGTTFAELLQNAAQGMMALITGRMATGSATEIRRLEVSASGRDEILRELLSEILYLVATQRVIATEFMVEEIGEQCVSAVFRTFPMTEALAHDATEIKAVTWHGLRVDHDESGYVAEVVFDT